MANVVPCLWFDSEAEEAAQFYTSLFDDSEVLETSRYGEGQPRPAGTVLTVRFTVRGQEFTALNGGPEFTFNEAVSFQLDCADQAEVDRYWDGLVADGGEAVQCGWVKDRFGLSWQVIPRRLPELLNGEDRDGAQRALTCMLGQVKIDVAELERAYAGA